MAKRARGSPQSGLSWDDLEEALATGSARGRTRASTATELDALFDESELRALRRLAAHARLVRSRSPALGNVVFLHGITGSNLATVDASGDRDHVWVNVPRLIAGRIARLKLRPDGKQEADARHRVELAGLNKTYYARGVLALRARWNVEPFAYDWRKDIDFASDELARFIREKFPGKPVHLVAHSMGGLVARNLIRRQPQLWDAMKDPDLAGGGRLVMLGTPNYGSYAIPQVLTGSDQMMELLELLDVSHNMPELLEITNSFPGSYMLLPAPQKLPTALRALYQRDTWGDVPGVSQQHLDRTFQFYHDLEQNATIDPARMIYVAGARRATITGMAIVARGEFEYQLSFAGDGRVPHALGLLKDVATYYVDEIHGDLARNETVLAAVDELLERGTTSVLGTTVLRRVDRAVPTMRDYRTAADKRLMEELERIAREAKARGEPDAVSADDAKLGGGSARQGGARQRAAIVAEGGACPEAGAHRRPPRRPHRAAGCGPLRRCRAHQGADRRGWSLPRRAAGQRDRRGRPGARRLDHARGQAGDDRRQPRRDLLHPGDGEAGRRRGGRRRHG